jgi:sulfoxide reductase heme-binding subunit YedZ
MRRRLIGHHVLLAAVSAAGLVVAYALTASANPVYRASMATAYVGMALLVATLAIGPLNVLRRRANPVSTDVRRDIGIWAGALAVAHFLIGWHVHMKHRYLYWLREVPGTGTLAPRQDLFGFANYTGLAAVLVAVLLLLLSNDVAMRRLGTRRWKSLQRWSYALVALVVAHGIAYQVIEKRKAAFVVVFALLSLITALAQYLGYRRRIADARPESR